MENKKYTTGVYKKYRKGSPKYARAIMNQFYPGTNDTIKKIKERRRLNYRNVKLGVTGTYKQAQYDINFMEIHEGLLRDIVSGAFINKKQETHSNNYISALESLGINKNLINFLKQNKNVITFGDLPTINTMYPYIYKVNRSKNGNKYRRAIEQASNVEEELEFQLSLFWGYDKNINYGGNNNEEKSS